MLKLPFLSSPRGSTNPSQEGIDSSVQLPVSKDIISCRIAYGLSVPENSYEPTCVVFAYGAA